MAIPIINLHFPLESWEGKNHLVKYAECYVKGHGKSIMLGPSSFGNTTTSHFSEARIFSGISPPWNPAIFASPKKKRKNANKHTTRTNHDDDDAFVEVVGRVAH